MSLRTAWPALTDRTQFWMGSFAAWPAKARLNTRFGQWVTPGAFRMTPFAPPSWTSTTSFSTPRPVQDLKGYETPSAATSTEKVKAWTRAAPGSARAVPTSPQLARQAASSAVPDAASMRRMRHLLGTPQEGRGVDP